MVHRNVLTTVAVDVVHTIRSENIFVLISRTYSDKHKWPINWRSPKKKKNEIFVAEVLLSVEIYFPLASSSRGPTAWVGRYGVNEWQKPK